VVEESVAGRNFDGGVDALLALEVLDHQTVVRFSNLKLKFNLSIFGSLKTKHHKVNKKIFKIVVKQIT
jgi:hypothetical protein